MDNTLLQQLDAFVKNRSFFACDHAGCQGHATHQRRSSKWVHETFSDQRLFAWQIKYGAFSVSVSQLDKITQYIENQENHHRRLTFQEEFIALLKKHNIDYDERYLWD